MGRLPGLAEKRCRKINAAPQTEQDKSAGRTYRGTQGQTASAARHDFFVTIRPLWQRFTKNATRRESRLTKDFP